MTDAWLIVVFVLVIVILFVGIGFAIWYSPCYQNQTNPPKKPKQGLPYLFATRSQVGSDVLPAIPLQASPTTIELNLPICDSKYQKVPRSGLYSVSYGVDINFGAEGTSIASVCVRRRSCKGNVGFEVVDSSVRQIAVTTAMLVPMSHTFLAQFTAGDQIELSGVSNRSENVMVPSSNSSMYLQPPETLASLVLTLIP